MKRVPELSDEKTSSKVTASVVSAGEHSPSQYDMI